MLRRALHLSPREIDHLQLAQAGALAQKRLARGLRLNQPETVALISSQVRSAGNTALPARRPRPPRGVGLVKRVVGWERERGASQPGGAAVREGARHKCGRRARAASAAAKRRLTPCAR